MLSEEQAGLATRSPLAGAYGPTLAYQHASSRITPSGNSRASATFIAHFTPVTPSVDVAFLISNHFKNSPKGTVNVLYSDSPSLDGKRADV